MGSVFPVYLPASEKKPSPATGETSALTTGEGVVLLVDDEPISLDVGKEMLERLGYTVLTATGGQEAIDIFQHRSADIRIIILDMIMPGISGGETFDRLKAIDANVRGNLSLADRPDYLC